MSLLLFLFGFLRKISDAQIHKSLILDAVIQQLRREYLAIETMELNGRLRPSISSKTYRMESASNWNNGIFYLCQLTSIAWFKHLLARYWKNLKKLNDLNQVDR